jgi:peptidoglycan/LPS O-acetylase OafA/YrhL
MKKILFCLFITAVMILMLTTVAFADGDPPAADEYLTWEFLGTMAGVVAATTLITQFCKFPLDKVWKIPTRFVVYVIALSILFAVEFFTGTVTTDGAILIILNAIIVTTAAMGTYEATFKRLESKPPTG